MRVAVLGYGTENTASTVFRYRACQKMWAEDGHLLDIYYIKKITKDFWSRIKSYDAIINQKALLRPSFGRKLFTIGIPVFFDFDDALWTRPKKPYSWFTQLKVNGRIRHWFKHVDGIITANRVLADFANTFTDRVYVVPMALDLSIWKPVPKLPKKEIIIGWAGSPGNLWHLEKLQSVLEEVLTTYQQTRLTVFSGKKPDFTIPFDYYKYEPGKEAGFIQSLDIGLLPLEYEPYSMGKSPLKALQYLSCGVPVVGNIKGAASEFLTNKNSISVNSITEWKAALGRLIENQAEIDQLGNAGVEYIRKYHNLYDISKELQNIIGKKLSSV
ncbi:MAG: glycosyltransferase [Candidatus Jettenia caeni]|nr:MAG: glycosyltransferase [Candidatus Jettenia caeni]